MRMGTFLMGGLLGAAAVLLFSRKNRPLTVSSFGQVGAGAGKLLTQAFSIWQRNKKTNGSADLPDHPELNRMVDKDAAVRREVDKILQEENIHPSH